MQFQHECTFITLVTFRKEIVQMNGRRKVAGVVFVLFFGTA